MNFVFFMLKFNPYNQTKLKKKIRFLVSFVY